MTHTTYSVSRSAVILSNSKCSHAYRAPRLLEREINTLDSDSRYLVLPPWRRSKPSRQIYQSRSCLVINHYPPNHIARLILYAAIMICHDLLYKNKDAITSVPKKTFRYGDTRRHYVCLHYACTLKRLTIILAGHLLPAQHKQLQCQSSSLILHLRRRFHDW